ncbi:MAG: glycoside hydrolase family 88 protein [Clostridiales bacterium]|jgi:unsaturated rhamnogalacturonyl hydrolase|nr:glycoside hydrolase family 88 protein [Clostridiales bacterium]
MNNSFGAWASRVGETFLERKPDLTAQWTYDIGIVLKGFEQLYHLTGNEGYFDYAKSVMDSFVQDDGSIKMYNRDEYALDNVNTGKVMFPLYKKYGDEKFKKAAEVLMDQLKNQPRSRNGVFWHKGSMPDQAFLDSTFMAGPFYAEYAKEFGEEADFDDVAKQFLMCEAYLRDAATGLLYHACDLSKKAPWSNPDTGLSESFWGRAMGWFCMGIADALEFFPKDHADRQKLADALDRALTALVKVQSPRGVWYQILDKADKPGNYLEASASIMFTYAMAKGIRLGLVDKAKYEQALEKAYHGIINEFITITNQGLVNLNKVCQTASLGAGVHDGSFAYYISEPIVSNDRRSFGALIRLCALMESSEG